MSTATLLLQRQDRECRRLLALSGGQGLAEALRRSSPERLTDTRTAGYALSPVLISLYHPGSGLYQSPELRALAESGLDYLERERRESGCFDLNSCNFDTAPDTAFALNELMDACRLMPPEDALTRRLLALIGRAAEGICGGGFHTPNHRWVIAAALKQAALLTGREDFSRRADVYLGEGLDINADGEFAERSTGIYNAVNDEQMLRLYEITGDRRYAEAARANLLLMRYYLEPDGSLLTQGSTRQDKGTRPAFSKYWIYYLMAGHFLDDSELKGIAAGIRERTPAESLSGLPWLLRHPGAEDGAAPLAPPERYDRVFPASGLGRWRRGGMSCTAFSGRPDFLYVMSGGMSLCVSLYGNVCDRRNFVPEAIRQTAEGCHLEAVAPSWYYLPFEGEGPDTRDWWAMDNPATRRRQIRDALRLSADIAVGEDSVTLKLAAEGLTGVPLRLELGFDPGLVEGEGFSLEGAPGASLYVSQGTLRVTGEDGGLSVGPCFGSHRLQRRMGGAFPLSRERMTVFLTDLSPMARELIIRAE